MSTETDQGAAPAADTETSKALKLVHSNIAEFDSVEAGLQDLEKKYKDVVYPVATTQGLVEAKQARQAIRDPRYAVQHAVDNAKRPLEALKKAITRRGDEIIARIKVLEDPIHAQIKAREDEIEAAKEAERQREAEAARVAAEKIQAMQEAVILAVNQPVEVIDEKLALVEAMAVSIDVFGERTGEAEQARTRGIATLKEMRVQREAFDQQQADLQRQQEEQRQRDEAERIEREKREAEEQRQATARREQQEREDRERRERLDREEAELNERRKKLEAEETAAREKREAQEQAEREERQRKEAAERAERDRQAEELRVKRAKWRDTIDSIKGLPPLCTTVQSIDEAIRRIGDVYMTEENFGEYLEEADSVMKKALADLAERRVVQAAREEEAEAKRLEWQRNAEEHERAEAAEKRKRDASDTMLTALRKVQELVGVDNPTVWNVCAEAIHAATGNTE